MDEYDYGIFEEHSGWWDDQNIRKRIESIVEEAGFKYNIYLGKWHEYFIFDILYSQLFAGDSNPNRYIDADSLLKFMRLKRDVILKDKTYKTELEISKEFIEIIQGLLYPIAERVLGWGTLIGFSDEDKYEEISRLAEAQKESFKDILNDCVCFFRANGIFYSHNKNISNKEAAYIYDIFYGLKYELNANIPINWSNSPDIASNAEKKSIIIKLIKKN